MSGRSSWIGVVRMGESSGTRPVSAEEADKERERIRKEFGLPVCDVLRHGAGELVETVLELRSKLLL